MHTHKYSYNYFFIVTYKIGAQNPYHIYFSPFVFWRMVFTLWATGRHMQTVRSETVTNLAQAYY